MTTGAKPEVLVVSPIPADLRAALAEDFNLVEFKADMGKRPGGTIAVTMAIYGISKETADALPDLRLVANQGAGLDKIDLADMARRGVKVSYTPDVVTPDTADQGLALMYAAMRRTPQADKFVRDGRWSNERIAPTRRVRGKTAGIVGLGRIGRTIAEGCKGVGMNVLYTGPNKKNVEFGYVPTIGELAEKSDVLIIAAAVTPQTRGIVNADVLKKLGPDGVLVNIARGAVVVEEDLIQALQNKSIYGAGLDVFENEPNPDKRFFDLDNVVLQPHCAAITTEGRAGMVGRVRGDIHAFLEGRDFENAAAGK